MIMASSGLTCSHSNGKKFPVTPSTRHSHCRRKFPVLNRAPRKKFPVVKSFREERRKYPVTQEVMAMHIGQNKPCTCLAHTFYLDALQASVHNLVFKQATRYAATCHSEANDMFQDCWVRIISKLHTYKSHRSKFTTWVYRVSGSVLNKNYRRGQKRAGRIVEMTEGLDENRIAEEKSTDSVERSDFRDTIEQLKERHPDEASMIDAIFMDADGDLNHGIVYLRAAKTCGVKASKVSKFFKEVIRPFFVERFKGENCYE